MKYFVFCQSDLVLEKVADHYEIPTAVPTEPKPWTTVMDIDGVKAFRIDTPLTDNDRYEMCPLRQSYYKLPEADYLKAGKCHELLYWDQNTKFCGVCGGTMRFDTAISKKCEHCGKEIWPSLATAVIVLIRRRHPGTTPDATTTDQEEVLLVHANSFRDNHYGLVAGFVETGETLEQAVHREVMESPTCATSVRSPGPTPADSWWASLPTTTTARYTCNAPSSPRARGSTATTCPTSPRS